MKLDTNRLIGRYIILSKEGLSHNISTGTNVCGPVESVSYCEEGLILTTNNNNDEFIIYLNENNETNDIEFISQYLWRIVLYNTEHHN